MERYYVVERGKHGYDCYKMQSPNILKACYTISEIKGLNLNHKNVLSLSKPDNGYGITVYAAGRDINYGKSEVTSNIQGHNRENSSRCVYNSEIA